ncbi:MAG: class I SAM-dependent methyltransferase [Patescibacteria group bacterium]|nr:class I SAM-dependent methyltransferase [Patescibacteria group bacterium]
MMFQYSPELQNKIIAYYEKYYKSCGLNDFEQRAKERLNEEDWEMAKMEYWQKMLNVDFTGQKHLVFGAGTGGLAVVLAEKFGAEVFGIEPDKEEFSIIVAKCRETGVSSSNFKQEFGEQMSFAPNQFDFVHCFTVLEHVQNVEKCLQEMVRVVKPGGHIHIGLPNYAFPAENHYKMAFPTFLPKIFGYFYLWLMRKPLGFLKSINFLSEKKLDKLLFSQKNIVWSRFYESGLKRRSKKHNFFWRLLVERLFVYPDQEIVIKKL